LRARSVPDNSEAQAGDPAQYILQKLSLADVHRMVRGTNVPIAVIDSESDATHPDLEGTVAQRYDAVGTRSPPCDWLKLKTAFANRSVGGICDAAAGGHGRSRRGHFRERLPRPPFPAGERGRLSLAGNFFVYDL
jgi:hypothetical protein